MFSRVDGSMATAARARRTGGRAVLAREEVPAVSATRRCRKDEPKKEEVKKDETKKDTPK